MNKPLLPMLVLLLLAAAGCEDGSVDLVGQEPDASTPADTTLEQDAPNSDAPMAAEADDAVAAPCTVESNCATGATFCCAWRGDVYFWNPAVGCRRKVHSLVDATPYECLDTGEPASAPGACKGYSTQTCYARDRGDEEIEVIISSVWWPTEYTAESEWHLCSDELKAAVAGAEEC